MEHPVNDRETFDTIAEGRPLAIDSSRRRREIPVNGSPTNEIRPRLRA